MRSELSDKYVDPLFNLYKDRVPASADLVCYWFEKARNLIETGHIQRAGLLATQAIRGGANRTVLERIAETGGIFFAYSDRDWILDGATVHVSMVGFDDGSETQYELDGKTVAHINTNLTSIVDVTQAKKLAENANLVFGGTKKGGPFDLTDEVAKKLLSMGGNPNGRPNSDVIKPWVNGTSLVKKARKSWIIDFGADMSKEDASMYEGPFEYVKTHVYPIRSKNRMETRRRHWWLHSVTSPKMRNAVSDLKRYIATPRVSKYRIYVWVPAETIPDDGTYIFAREDDYFFGIIHSSYHELWARIQGTQLREAESGSRYTPTTTFGTFPFPWPPGQEPAGDPRVQAIAQAARELVQKRDAWLNPPGASPGDLKTRTLTNLYNQRPTWLDLAHRNLDQAVLDAYGWPHPLTDDQILERLLALNLERAQAQEKTP